VAQLPSAVLCLRPIPGPGRRRRTQKKGDPKAALCRDRRFKLAAAATVVVGFESQKRHPWRFWQAFGKKRGFCLSSFFRCKHRENAGPSLGRDDDAERKKRATRRPPFVMIADLN
jgi:hypothetical protein